MAKETERKFLIASPIDAMVEATSKAVDVYRIDQGYLTKEGTTIRVRIIGVDAFLTIKGPKVNGSSDEYEYPIPVDDAKEMLEKYSVSRLTKIRYVIPLNDELAHMCELDVFQSYSLNGKMIAEVELGHLHEDFNKPKWFGEEVTDDKRYTNVKLASKGWPSN